MSDNEKQPVPASPAPKPVAKPPQASPEGEGEVGIERRKFIRNAMYGGIGLWTGGSLLGAGAMFWPTKVTGFGAKIDAGPLENYAPGTVTVVRDGKFYLSRLPSGNLVALYWKCAHLGCTVPWVEGDGLFKCPCHGSWYEPTGQNVAGPAPRPLDIMAIAIEDGKVIVDTGDIKERPEGHNPAEHEFDPTKAG